METHGLGRESEMQATQTQQGLLSVLEARGLFFTFPMMGLVLGVWFGFFRLDLSSWNFSFHFPPCCAGHPCVGFVQKFCSGVPATERRG